MMEPSCSADSDMYEYLCRERDAKNCSKYELRSMIEITATHEYLPLKDVNWLERWCALPEEYTNVFEQIINFEVRTDDVFVVTFMKCGTTWMQETAWLLMNNLNYQRAKSEELSYRSVYLEMSGLWNTMRDNSIEMCKNQQSPRVIKSHLPMNLLPKQLWQKKPKIIYVARNIKDVVVSTYHHHRGLGLWSGDLNDFVPYFINNGTKYAPYWDHIVDFWKMRHEPHVFFVTYEEMRRNLAGVIKKLCLFLERPQLTALELNDILEHLSFKNMKENKRTNITYILKDVVPSDVREDFQFMRRGIVGSYKDELSAENQRILGEWTQACLVRYGIKEEDIFGDI